MVNMHSIIVLVWCLRVNGLKREWQIDLPELTSIQLGNGTFCFKQKDESTELIMQSGDDEMNWWIELPKLTTLTAEGIYSETFCYPRTITLEGVSYHPILINRHALSHYCYTSVECFQMQENRSYQECHHPSSAMPRYHFRFATLYPISSFFHTQ